MAQLADMNIKIGADVSDAVDKINQLKKANLQLAEETSHLSAEYKKNAKELRDLEAALKSGVGVTNQTAGRIGFLKDQQKQLSGAIVENKELLKQSTTAVNNYDKSISGTTKTHNKFGEAVKKITDINDLGAKAVSKLERAFSGLVEGGIVGAVVAISGPLIAAFADWFDSLNHVNKAQEVLNLAMAEAAGSTGGEVAQLNALVAIARDTSLSYAARTQAIKELNKEYPGLHGNIKLENINTKIATDLINKEVEAIKRRAEVKAVERLIDEASIKLEKARLGKADEQGFWQTLPAQVSDATTQMGNSISKLLGTPGLFGGTDNAFHKAFVDPIIEATKEIDLLSKKLQEIETISAKEGTLFIGKPTPLNKLFEIDLAKLEKNYEEVQRLRQKTLGANTSDISKNGIAVKDVLLQDEINFLTKKEALLNKFNKDDFANFKALEAAKNKLSEENLKFLGEQKIPNIATKLQDITKELTKKIDLGDIPKPKLNPEDIAKLIRIDDFEKMAVLVSDKLTPAFDAFFNTIIDGSGNAFSAFGNALLKSIEQMIAAIAKAAILAELISVIFPSVGGFNALFGKFLHFSQGGPVRRFAEGGPIKGPGSKTSDSILARLSAGEYVVKADVVNKWGVDFFNKINSGKGFPNINGMLPKFAAGGLVSSNLANLGIGGGQQVFIPNVKIQGKDLVLVFNRAQASINRNG